MKISVFGLGYVGMVNVACLSKLGHELYGCDIKQHKVDMLSAGQSTVLEPGIDEIIEESLGAGRIKATSDATLCVQETELALICVGTPSDATGDVNLNYILNTAREITRILKALDKPFTMVFRSTIPPGTIDDQILPAIAPMTEGMAHPPRVVFLPEFLREGNAVKDFFECARVVVGLDDAQNAKDQLADLFGFNDLPIVFTNYRTAEFVKYVDNAYHATKVAFANEMYSIGSAVGADVVTANELFLMDDILNISKRYLRPGMPFGGSCLPKDTRALLHMGKEVGVKTPFVNGVFESNHAHQQRIFDKVMAFESDKVLMCGITFKQNTDDVRESPFVFLLEALVEAGKEVRVYDPNLNLVTLRIEFPHLVQYIHPQLDELVGWGELIVLNTKNYAEVLAQANAGQAVLNCLNNDHLSTESVQVTNLY